MVKIVSIEVFIMFAASCSHQVFGYPADFNLKTHNRISNEISEESEMVYKFPTVISDNLETQIKGFLNMESDSLSVSLPGNGEYCKIKHNFKKNKISLSPTPIDSYKSKMYRIGTKIDYADELEFVLTLKARSINGYREEILDVTYEVIGYGVVTDLRCNVHFDDLGYIVFEGARHVNSILFSFE